MVGVHIGVNLKDKACHLLLIGLHGTCLRSRGARRGSDADKALQKLSYTEVIYRRAKEHGSQLTCQIILAVELIINSLHQVQILAQLRSELLGDVAIQLGVRYIAEIYGLGIGRLALVRGKEREVFLVDVIYALERIAA